MFLLQSKVLLDNITCNINAMDLDMFVLVPTNKIICTVERKKTRRVIENSTYVTFDIDHKLLNALTDSYWDNHMPWDSDMLRVYSDIQQID